MSLGRTPVGVVRRAHGVEGAVVVSPSTDAPDIRFVPGAVFVTEDESRRTLTVESVGDHGDGLLVRFTEVRGRDAAEELRSRVLTIAAGERRDLMPGEFWPEQLIGASVGTPDGIVLGAVVDVVVGGAQDRLVVETPDGTRVEVPFVDALVPLVDIDARSVIIDPPDELFPVRR